MDRLLCSGILHRMELCFFRRNVLCIIRIWIERVRNVGGRRLFSFSSMSKGGASVDGSAATFLSLSAVHND